MDWRLIRTNRYQRCCRYAGTVDCPPCAGPSSSWRINQASPGKIDPQQVWLVTPGDNEVFGVGNFRMKQDVSSSKPPVWLARSTGQTQTSLPVRKETACEADVANTVQSNLKGFCGQ